MLKGNFVHNSTGYCPWSNLTMLSVPVRAAPFTRSLAVFFREHLFSKRKCNSKDLEQEGRSHQWMEAFSTMDRVRERHRDAESLMTLKLHGNVILCAQNVITKLYSRSREVNIPSVSTHKICLGGLNWRPLRNTQDPLLHSARSCLDFYSWLTLT